MPIYEYQCEACGHILETLQKISEAPLTKCPECGKDALKKLISASAFRLKGGGWYETDFKTGNKKNVAQSEKKAASGSKKETGAKSGSTATKKKSSGTD
jgi:putative FmdB family regulatory protein